MTAKTLPREITSYDLLKCFALLTMIADHVGYFFFPDEETWRAVGRLSAPVWLFLIGYARSRDLSGRLWIGAAVLTAAAFILGKVIFPLTILWGMLLTRHVIDRIAKVIFQDAAALGAFMFLMFLISLPTSLLFDYGSLCLTFALFGYAVRHRGEALLLQDKHIKLYGGLNVFVYAVLALLVFGFDQNDFLIVVAGVSACCSLLYCFRPAVYSEATTRLPGVLVWLVQIGGRRTLEIYVLHLVLFRILAWQMGYEGYGLFQWKWFE